MIQAVNSTNFNYSKVKSNPNFGDKNAAQTQQAPEFGEEKKTKKPSKLKGFMSYVIAQFAAGAIFSTLLDGGGNLFEKMKKVPNKENIVPALNILKRAAFIGTAFVVTGLVIDSIFRLMSRPKAEKQ